MTYLTKQLQKLENECSKHWIHQIKEASQKENINDIEYSTYSLLRFFRSLDETEIQEIQIDDFYRQIIQFIKDTEQIKNMNNSNFIHFFRCITHIIISDFYRGFDELNKIQLNTSETEEESDSFPVEKSDIFYLNLSCLTFFKRYKDAFSLIQKMEADEVCVRDELMQIDSQIRRSFILSKLKRRGESALLLSEVKSNELIGLYPLLTMTDIEFQIGANFFSDTKENSIKNGFDILMNISSTRPDIAFFQIAYTYASTGSYENALDYVVRISEIERKFGCSLLHGFILYKLDKFAESYEILKDLLKCSQFTPPLFELIGLLFLKTGNIKHALDFLRNAHVLCETDITYSMNYGLALECQIETEDAADRFYEEMMMQSFDWEPFADRSCALNLRRIQRTWSCDFCQRIVEPQLENIVASPADEQIDRFMQCPPFFARELLAPLATIECDAVPVSPLQRRISLFHVE